MPTLDETHDPKRQSWVESANDGATDFPIQNLPYGVFKTKGGPARGGVAIGDRILDLSACLQAGLFAGDAKVAAEAAAGATLNPLMALGRRYWSALRRRLSDILRADGPERAKVEPMAATLLVPMAEAEMQLPAAIGSFTDFMASIFHTERGGRLLRPDNPVPENFKYVPIAYNSRATSVRPSGEPVRRPNGQFKTKQGVEFGPCRQLDFELEVGLFVGPGNPLGMPVPMEQAQGQIFGYCLVNDWSARDIQRWESNPLGPFLAKSLSTTIAPWIVTADALAPFAAPAFARAPGDPAPLPYLHAAADQAEGGIDFRLDALLSTPAMRAKGQPPALIARSNFKHMYWTPAQLLTHHTSNGCNLQPGDLLASGTVSGPTDDSRCCLAEITERGNKSFTLPQGETRTFLEDGDEVIFLGRAERQGYASIGFGECRGRVEPAVAWPGAKVG
ncbi:MAG: fumarylacetoacetase [Variibacter sp.]|nr:fumarylacetoacetase [Variibacter sp.]